MDEVEQIKKKSKKAGTTAFISREGSKYNVTYYLPAQQAVEKFEKTSVIQIDQNSLKKASETSKEEKTPLLQDHRELLLPSNIMDLSPQALSYMDNQKYRISYYVKLKDYYKEKQEYEQKLQRHLQGDKEAFEEKRDPFIFYSRDNVDISAESLSEIDGKRYKMSYYIELEKYNKEMREYREKMLRHHAGEKDDDLKKQVPGVLSQDFVDLSAKGLSEADGKRYKMSYYIELEKYNKETREYNEKMLRYESGDKKAFDETIAPSIFYSKDTSDLSAKALSELDGKKYKMSYYEKLRNYQKEREDYERKLVLYKAGQTDIFEKKEEVLPLQDIYSFTAEALSCMDGKKYKMSYYKKLKDYYDEIQDYNKKLSLLNAGQKDLFKEKPGLPDFYSRDKSDLSPKALSELDGKKHKMSYYVKLKDYYKELEEYELKKALYESGINVESQNKSENSFTVYDKLDINLSQKDFKDKIWTPGFDDMMTALKGRVAPYFMENLLSSLQSVDGEFDRKFASPLLRIYMNCSTELASEEELLKELQKIR